MPGNPAKVRGGQVNTALGCRKLFPHEVDACAREVLKLVKRVQPLGIPEYAEEKKVDTPETAALLREVGSNGLVLLKNKNSVLPFNKDKSTAIIGPNAAIAAFCGGGSAALEPYYAVAPLDGLKAQCTNTKYCLGAPGYKKPPYLSYRTKTEDDKQGLTMKVYLDPSSKPQRQQIDEVHVSKSDVLLFDYKHPELPDDNLYFVTLGGNFIPDETSEYEFSLSVCGTGKVFVDDKLVVDNATKQTPGDSFFGSGTIEETGKIRLEEGKSYSVLVDFATLPTMTFKTPGTTGFGAGGLRCGLERVMNTATELERAVKLAKECDQVVLCMGLNSDWESEGYDRETMDLPPGSDELIKAVCAANPNTAVVVQSGTPVTMTHWLSGANAIVQAWYGGNETGNAIADVVFGKTNPGGKLPLSFPLRNEDNPAFLNYRSERGRTIYGEDVYIGYRFYEKTKKEVAFAFGHGLSYTTFEISDLAVSYTETEDEITVSATVSNTGSTDGSEVVQVYISQVSPSINRAPKELKGFTKVAVKTGGKEAVKVKISKKYATSFYDEETSSWIMEKGKYEVLVGNSSESVKKAGVVELSKTSYWTGL
jgi:beta-glucosidase